jgi:predicted esterase
MTTPDLNFVHVYEPPADPEAPVLLLLHGTGGDERDLLPLAAALRPGAGVLSPRGKVLEHGMPRFFRRLAEGVFDLEDLERRTRELAVFLARAAEQYGIDRRLVAVGFSNGANIAASLLLLEPGSLAGAVLFRAMVPLVPDPMPRIPGTPVLLSNGRMDPLVPAAETERLAALLREAGADVTLVWQPAGHALTPGDVVQAREWLASQLISVRS